MSWVKILVFINTVCSPSPIHGFEWGTHRVLRKGRDGGHSPQQLHIPSFHRSADIFQNIIPITLDQLIKQPQHGLDHPRMWRNLPRRAECLNRIVRRGDPLGRPYNGNPTQRQPLRIQRGIILGRFGKDFIRLRNRADKSLLCGDLIPCRKAMIPCRAVAL